MTLNDQELAFIAALDAAVEAKGEDYIYEKWNDRCVYVYNGQPSCLIGHALARLAPADTLALEGTGDNTAIALNQVGRTLPGVRYGVAKAAQVAQDTQDGGGSWGKARRLFHYELIREGLVPVN